MDLLLAWANGIVCALIACGLLAAILSPRVRDGVVIKVGLICMALGFGGIAVDMLEGLEDGNAVRLSRCIALVSAGVIIVAGGYLHRCARAGAPQRRVSDWSDLDTRPGVRSVPGREAA